MDSDDDYYDPYEEAEAEAAAEAAFGFSLPPQPPPPPPARPAYRPPPAAAAPSTSAAAPAAVEESGAGDDEDDGGGAGDDEDEDEEIDSDGESDYEEKTYAILKTGNHRVRNPDGTFRCPFCAGKKKQDYRLKDLLQHADGVGASVTRRRGGRERAVHRAFARFVRSDIATDAPSPAPSANPALAAASLTAPVAQPYQPPADNELFAWPWTGILATTGIDADKLVEKAHTYNPINMALLVDHENSGAKFCVMKFSKNWTGFRDALLLENKFKTSGFGRMRWYSVIGSSEPDLTCFWVAREADHNETNPVGRHLRKCCELKTVDEVSKQEHVETGKMVAILAGQIEVKNRYLLDMESRYTAVEVAITRLEEDKKMLHDKYNEEMRNMQRNTRESAHRIFIENEKLKAELDKKSRELTARTKELDNLEAKNDGEKNNIEDEKQKAKYENTELELARIEQQKADEDVLRLVEEQKREKEAVLTKMLQLEKQLEQKQQLELEIAQLNGTLQVLKHLEGEDDSDIHEKMEKISGRLVEEKNRLEELQTDLISKERKSNDELQEIRKVLIGGLEEMLSMSTRALIGTKRMGELDMKPFQTVCKKKYSKEEADEKAAELCSSWQDELMKPLWHPFKIANINGKDKEIVDDDDPKLRALWLEYGDDVCNAVKAALLELNEYNASGRYVVTELWNFKEQRRATVKEVLLYIHRQWKQQKRKR